MASLKRSATASSPRPAVTTKAPTWSACALAAPRNRRAPHWRGPRGGPAAGAACAASRSAFRAGVVGEQFDVVAHGVRRPEAENRRGAEPSLRHDLVEHLARVVVEAARGVADDLVVEDRREFAGQFPGREERRPVDELDQLGDRIILDHARADEATASAARMLRPVELERVPRAHRQATAAACSPRRGHARRRCGRIRRARRRRISRGLADISAEATPTARLASVT